MKVLVTGASGFVGSAVVRHLAVRTEFSVVAAARTPIAWPDSVKHIKSPDLYTAEPWGPGIHGVDAIVHCAGLAHLPTSQAARAQQAFDAINHRATVQLAREAIEAGVQRLIFLSSIKVHGEGQPSVSEPAYRHDSPFAPQDAYAASKVQAELALMELGTSASLKTTVIRPPLIHGPGAGANFAALMRLVAKGYPLPLASINNARSILGLGNLCDLISHCLIHPEALGKAFLASDGAAWSTPELIRAIAKAMGRPSRLFSFPPALLGAIARASGQGAAMNRLNGSLIVDDSATRAVLQWSPPEDPGTALANTVRAFLVN
jgi:nucleoside-diphosphate-sugar epimerase